MGKIYVNPKTGELWESNVRKKKPPEGFEFTGYSINYHYCREYHARTYYCPSCSMYHVIIKLYNWPLYAEMMVKWGSKYGCAEMMEMMGLMVKLGSRKVHYEMVEKLKEVGLTRKVIDLIERYKLDTESVKAIIKMFLDGKSEEDVLVFLIARELSRR